MSSGEAGGNSGYAIGAESAQYRCILPRMSPLSSGMFVRWLACVCLCTVGLGAAQLDTTVVAARGDTIRLDSWFVDWSTCQVLRTDSGGTSVHVRILDDSAGVVVDDTLVLPGTALHVRASSAFMGLPRTIRLNTRKPFDTALVTRAPGDSIARPSLASGVPEGDELTVDGFKSVSVSLGNQGQANLEQALDVTLGGRLSRGAVLSGHISDQSASLDGGTRELSEVDRVYLSVKHPRYEIVAGDQLIEWPRGGMIDGSKQIKGISAAYTSRPFTVRAFGAIAGGKYAAQTINGRAGLQGPYFLTGNGEADIITPVAGTVRVTLDGRELSDARDYTVDADYGSITFAPTVPITDRSIARVEYEYKTFDYRRSVVGGDLALAVRDSLLRVTGALWSEADNGDDPIDLEISALDRRLLAASGDSSLERLVAVPVDSRDIDEWSVRYPLYAKQVDSTGDTMFVYTPYDPLRPDAIARTLYWVRFRDVDSGGDYVVDTVDYRGPVYRYVGGDSGTAVAGNPLPLPQRTTLGEVRARVRAGQWLALDISAAGMSHDRNRFSDRGDADNNGAATHTRLRFQTSPSRPGGAWLDAEHRLLTRDYTREVVDAYQMGEVWQSGGFSDARALRQVWEAGVGVRAGRWAKAEGGFGQVLSGDSVATQRVSARVSGGLPDRLQLSYDGRYYRRPSDQLERVRRESVSATLSAKRHEWGLAARDEWRYDTNVGRGEAGAKAWWDYRSGTVRQSVQYTLLGVGDSRLTSLHDTSRALVWEQSLRVNPSALWRFEGGSMVRYQEWDPDSSALTILAQADAGYAHPRRRFSTGLSYRLSSERAAQMVQVPAFVGQGLGGFAYDSVRHELVPSSGGSYSMREQEVYDNSVQGVVRKSDLNYQWTLRPSRRMSGIFGDLGLRGELQLLEHVLDDSAGTALAWVPGFLTVSGRESEAVPVSNCYYEQRLSWEPDSGLSMYRAELSARIYTRESIRGREEGLRGTLGGSRSGDRWTNAVSVQAVRYAFDGLETFDVLDAGMELTQRLRFAGDFFVSLGEHAGWARRDDESGWYAALRPGAGWQGSERGWADLGYSYSYVAIPGTIDYSMARGFAGGHTHRIDCRLHARLGAHFEAGGGYRGEWRKAYQADTWEASTHTLTLEVKAML